MKKALIPILLVLLLTLAFTSCDANIRQDIAGLMGGFNENVYIASGMVEPNTANAAAVTETTANIGTGDSALTITETTDSTFGISVTVPNEVKKIIRPQTPAEQEEIKDDLATAFASPTQTKQLVESLKAPITDSEQVKAAEGTILLFNATLDKLKNDLATNNEELSDTLSELALPEIEEGEELTQGDVLLLQMMTNLISNTVATLNETTTTTGDYTTVDGDALTSDMVLSIVDDALFTAQVAEQLSGTGSIDFSGQLDLAGLLSSMDDDTDQSVSRISRVEEDEDDMGEILVAFNDLIPDLLPVMGITVSGENFTYTQSKYKSFLMNQKVYRGSIEHALRFAEKSGLELSEVPNANFDTSTLIKYILSVVITEHHAYWLDVKPEDPPDDFPRPEALIASLFDTNPKLGLGTMTEDDEVNPPELEFSYDEFEAFIADRPYEVLIQNLKDLNLINGISQLEEVLDELETEIGTWADEE